jgi:hypothetical protein
VTPIGSAHERQEVFNRELRLLEYVRERRRLYGSVRRDDDLERFLIRVLLQTDMAAVLAHYHPAATLERADDSVVRQIRDFPQTEIYTNSA